MASRGHGFVCWKRSEFQPFFSAFHTDGIAIVELTAQVLDRQWVLQLALDGPFERAGTIIGIITDLGQICACLRADYQVIAALCQQCGNMPELDVHDLNQIIAAERMEDDDLVD